MVCPAVAVYSVMVLYAVVVTPDAGIPKYLTEIFPVALGGAAEKLSVRPETEYVSGDCRTPDTATSIDAGLAGETDMVNAVVLLSPLNKSVTNADCEGLFPMYDIV